MYDLVGNGKEQKKSQALNRKLNNLHDKSDRMRGEEIQLKTEADDTVFIWLYVCIKQWQWAFRQTEGDPITLWYHCNQCEWELNHFDDPYICGMFALWAYLCNHIPGSNWKTTQPHYHSRWYPQRETFRSNRSSCRTWRVQHEQLF